LTSQAPSDKCPGGDTIRALYLVAQLRDSNRAVKRCLAILVRRLLPGAFLTNFWHF
jgi:hypothetical protein